MSTQILIRRGIAGDWTAANTVLGLGELGFESNTLKVKIGDGVTLWTMLPYWDLGLGITAIMAAITNSVKDIPLFLATAGQTVYPISALNGKTIVGVWVGSQRLNSDQYSLSGNNFTFLNLAFPFDGTEQILILYKG